MKFTNIPWKKKKEDSVGEIRNLQFDQFFSWFLVGQIFRIFSGPAFSRLAFSGFFF